MLAVLKEDAAANYVGLSVPTLQKKRSNGDGPRFLKLGRSVRYRLSDLDAWLDAAAVASTSEAQAAEAA